MTATIFMPLLNEGTDVWRPVEAVVLENGRYRVIGHAPDDEEWTFPTGMTVIIDHESRIVSAASY